MHECVTWQAIVDAVLAWLVKGEADLVRQTALALGY